MTISGGEDRDVERFDRRAYSYEHGWRAEFHSRVVAATLALALQAVPEPVAVLAVGCATGALLRALASRLPDAVELAGVDPVPAMIEVGRTLKGDTPIRLQKAFAEHLPFDDESFDLVVSSMSFHHWTDQSLGLGHVP